MMFYSADNLDDIFRMVMAWDIDGVVTLSFTKRDCEKMYYMIEKPVVSIDAYGELEGNQIVPNIGLDDISGGYMMTQYLLNIGYDQIFVCASRDHGVDHMRWEGAQQALGHFRQREAKVYFYGAWQKPLRERKALCRTCQSNSICKENSSILSFRLVCN